MVNTRQPAIMHPNLIKYLKARELVDAIEQVFDLSGELGWHLDINMEAWTHELSANIKELEDKIHVVD